MPRHHRISRGLIGLLGVVLVLGLAFYFNNVRKTRASEPPSPAPRAQSPDTSSPNRTTSGAGAASVKPTASTPPKFTVSPPTLNPMTRSNDLPQNRGRSAPGSGGSATATGSTQINLALTKKSAGDPLGARKILNDALLAGSLNPNETDAAKRLLADINQTVVFSPKVVAGDEFASSYTVKSGDLMRAIGDRHDVPWELLLRLNNMNDPRKLRAGQNLKVITGPFHAVVSKRRYMLDVYLGSPGERGSVYVRSFPVGLGADDSTPTGTWLVEIHKKIKNPTYFSPRGEGVIEADDPKNPLGERWIGLTGIDGQAVGKQSYGIHGTIEPESIGKQASMGCIRLRNEDAELLFDMLCEGKSVVIVRE